jgi:hypothetical protein
VNFSVGELSDLRLLDVENFESEQSKLDIIPAVNFEDFLSNI